MQSGYTSSPSVLPYRRLPSPTNQQDQQLSSLQGYTAQYVNENGGDDTDQGQDEEGTYIVSTAGPSNASTHSAFEDSMTLRNWQLYDSQEKEPPSPAFPDSYDDTSSITSSVLDHLETMQIDPANKAEPHKPVPVRVTSTSTISGRNFYDSRNDKDLPAAPSSENQSPERFQNSVLYSNGVSDLKSSPGISTSTSTPTLPQRTQIKSDLAAASPSPSPSMSHIRPHSLTSPLYAPSQPVQKIPSAPPPAHSITTKMSASPSSYLPPTPPSDYSGSNVNARLVRARAYSNRQNVQDDVDKMTPPGSNISKSSNPSSFHSSGSRGSSSYASPRSLAESNSRTSLSSMPNDAESDIGAKSMPSPKIPAMVGSSDSSKTGNMALLNLNRPNRSNSSNSTYVALSNVGLGISAPPIPKLDNPTQATPEANMTGNNEPHTLTKSPEWPSTRSRVRTETDTSFTSATESEYDNSSLQFQQQYAAPQPMEIFAGEGRRLSSLVIPVQTTHLLLSKSPSGVDLSYILPPLRFLTVLDVSSSKIPFLPQLPTSLQELNISSNPLTSLPNHLGTLFSLRMLLADDCLLTSLPRELSSCARLECISLRNNRFVGLPGWLSVFPILEITLIDGNPFQAPYDSVLSPIFSRAVAQSPSKFGTQVQTVSTPMMSPFMEERYDSPESLNMFSNSESFQDNTQRSNLNQSASNSKPFASPYPPSSMTAPPSPVISLHEQIHSPPELTRKDFGMQRSVTEPVGVEPTLRKMKSAGEMRAARNGVNSAVISNSASATPLPQATSMNSKYGSLNPRALAKAMEKVPKDANRSQSSMQVRNNFLDEDGNPIASSSQTYDDDSRGKPGKGWSGLLKKMSMGRLRSASSSAFGQKPGEQESPPSMPSRQIPASPNKRKSFLSLDMAVVTGQPGSAQTSPSSLSSSGIPRTSRFINGALAMNLQDATIPESDMEMELQREKDYSVNFRAVMAYLRDLHDLCPVIDSVSAPSSGSLSSLPSPMERSSSPQTVKRSSRERRPTNGSEKLSSRNASESSYGGNSTAVSEGSGESEELKSAEGLKFRVDPKKRAAIIRETVDTERSYVKGLRELVDLYVLPSVDVVPSVERKFVFNGLESLLAFHESNFLPALERASGLAANRSSAVEPSVAYDMAKVFSSHAAYLKMYSSYVNNFDASLARLRLWTSPALPSSGNNSPSSLSPTSAASLVTLTLSMASVAGPSLTPDNSESTTPCTITNSQRKKIKTFMKKAKENRRHSQINLESYLLLPIQRIPRYRLLLEDMYRCTPPEPGSPEELYDPLLNALEQMNSLAKDINESKRHSEGRKRLVHWQNRIRGKFPSPLVQPHRRLILDGPLTLTRVVKRNVSFVQTPSVINGQSSVLQLDSLHQDVANKAIVALLCSDLMVLCRDTNTGADKVNGYVDLYAVLRLQGNTHTPATVVQGNTLRIVDTRAILYFQAPSMSDALTWCHAINSDVSGW